MDKITAQRIALLHPKLRDEVTQIIKEIDAKVSTPNSFVRITQGLRTFEEQDALFNQRPRVTKARGGESIHCYGLAIDICFIVDGKPTWETKKDWNKNHQSDWMEVVQIFKAHGFVWGGDWKTFVDMPHFDKSFGYTWKQLLVKYKKGDFIAGTKYVNI